MELQIKSPYRGTKIKSSNHETSNYKSLNHGAKYNILILELQIKSPNHGTSNKIS